MADNTAIEWTERPVPLKVRAAAASRLGLTLVEYDARRAAGQKWCGGCRVWQPLHVFAVDRSRGDGRVKWCREYANRRSRQSYTPKARPAAGRRFVAARDGDRKQARGRVNYLITAGLLVDPNAVPCVDCGHRWSDGERRHEYDHYLGYAAEHHEDVEAVCTTCHHGRERARRRAA